MADIKQDIKVEVEEQQNFAVSNQTDPKNLQELTQYIQTLLQQTQDKLQTMSEQIITRIDEMGTRIDDLEKNISDLMTQAGVEGTEK
ncbi:heat shock factor-binding protein 1 [Nilaparvata lugens]|uniref:heat shock factor-binding protein 1 n=1 Tax=Nilaparvata lugens TaxID=108931 RepID=UPI000B98AB40|nr:heat shock factor-binding protein 1 [Nilaparvata lugens]